jgi:hypothetical protein
VVTPGPSTTASAARLLYSHDPGVEVRYVDPSGSETPATLAQSSGDRTVFVVVSLVEGVQLPAPWAAGVRWVFASFKPDGTPADAVYRACAISGCP